MEKVTKNKNTDINIYNQRSKLFVLSLNKEIQPYCKTLITTDWWGFWSLTVSELLSTIKVKKIKAPAVKNRDTHLSAYVGIRSLVSERLIFKHGSGLSFTKRGLTVTGDDPLKLCSSTWESKARPFWRVA